MPLDKACGIILKDCMGLGYSERCLIVTDFQSKKIGSAIYKSALKMTKKSKLVLTSIPEIHGAEPPKFIAEEMLSHDVILLPTTMSLSHTKARKDASMKGARIASMPGITEGMMKRALNVNFYRIKKSNEMLISKLKGKNKIRVKTEKGTDIVFCLKGRKWKDDNGLYTKKGAFGNLPSGEIFIAPLENKTNGTLIVDASIGGLGKVDKDVRIEVKNGHISGISGGKTATSFKKLLKNKFYKNVAELGIGTNYKAKVTGNALEDEKVAGTCHVAFGNNRHFGGKVDVPFHVDVVIKNPMVYYNKDLIR